jgi:hypothetical protein
MDSKRFGGDKMKRLAPSLFLGFYLFWMVLIVVKACSFITVSWWVILVPIWMPFAFGSFILFFIFIVFLGFFGYIIWKPEYK